MLLGCRIFHVIIKVYLPRQIRSSDFSELHSVSVEPGGNTNDLLDEPSKFKLKQWPIKNSMWGPIVWDDGVAVMRNSMT